MLFIGLTPSARSLIRSQSGEGAIFTFFTTLAVYHDFAPATINYKVPDEECDLDIVPNTGRNATIRAAISNALGFGGHNASVLIKKYNA